MSFENKYNDLFDDHWEIARTKFKEKEGREPDFCELLDTLRQLMKYFYD